MAIRQKRRGKATTDTTEEVVLVDNMTGGLELNTAQSNLQPDQARRLSNFSLEEPGLLVTLQGWSTFSTTSLGAGRAQGGLRIYTTSGAFTLIAFDGSIYHPTDAGVWGSATKTGLNANNNIYFLHDRIVAMVMDSVNAPDMTKDGDTWYDVGITAPAAAPTVVDVAGGSLIDTNVYEFAYTYGTSSSFDSELIHESNGSDELSDTINTPNLTARLTVTYSTDPKVDTIYIYMRNTTTGQTVLRRITSIANNTGGGTTTVDITDDVEEKAAEIPTNHDLPGVFSFGVSWKNRLWARDATVKNRVYFTQVFENQTWPSNFFIDLPMDKGDDIESMVPLGDLLVCLGQSGIFLIVGQTSLDFEVRPALHSETGAFGFSSAQKIEAGVIHAGPPGVYLFDGASDRFLSLDIDKGWKEMVASATPADLTRIPIAYDKPNKQVAVGVPNLYPTGAAGEWILDLNRSRQREKETWFSSDREIGGYIVHDGHELTQGLAGHLHSWGVDTGEMYHERTGTSADGASILAEYEGPVFTTQLRHAIAVHGFVEYEPTSGTLAFEFFVDGVSQGTQSIDLGSGLATYGSATYHVSTYGGANRRTTVLTFPQEAEGRNFKVIITYQGTSRFRLLGYGFSLVTEAVISTI